MKRFVILVVVAACTLAVSAWKMQPSSTTITYIEHQTTEFTTDTGEAGDSVGDILTFSNAIYDEKNEKQVGSDQGYCIRVEVGVSYECNWTLVLEDGQIVVEGPSYDATPSVLAITGGTGAYADARGQMTLRSLDDKGSEYELVYEIMQ